MGKVNFLLLFIIFVAAILRLWGLGSVPPSPDWDEAALAYNAYSIIETGRDEYGKFLPPVLRSFDDYKPALYAYLTIPSILIFGVNTLAVRLPSAIFGILTVLATYFLLKELFLVNSKSKARNSKQAQNFNDKNSNQSLEMRNLQLSIPIVAAALLAISPWHIQFSRIAFETNVGLAFNVFAALFFVKGLKKPWLLSLSIVSMVLSIYVYQSEKVFVPLLALVLILIYRKELFALPKRYLVSAVTIGVILILPMVSNIVSDKNSLMRARGVSIFAGQTQLLEKSSKKLADDKESGNILGQVFHNRRLVFAKEISAGYLSHFDLNWLFIKGDLNRHHAPDMGLLYLWELPFLLMGIYLLLFGNFPKKIKLLIFFWFLIAPIPAAATTGVPHAVRTLNFLPTWQIFTAIGLVSAWLYVVNVSRYKAIRGVFLICFLLIASFNFSYYLNQYFVQQNYYFSEFWQYGYQQAVEEVAKIEHKYKRIVVSNEPLLDQSYIFFLFYLKYPPEKYQQETNTTAGFREIHKFGKYEFRPINWEKEEKAGTLFVGRPQDFSQGVGTVKVIHFLNGQEVIKIVEGY